MVLALLLLVLAAQAGLGYALYLLWLRPLPMCFAQPCGAQPCRAEACQAEPCNAEPCHASSCQAQACHAEPAILPLPCKWQPPPPPPPSIVAKAVTAVSGMIGRAPAPVAIAHADTAPKARPGRDALRARLAARGLLPKKGK
jgi:hypothetical protein